jgi:UDP-glucose 4-epimerase
MRALVTGGAGFIGSHLVERLLGRGDEVRVIDNFSSGKRANLEPVACSRLTVVEGDVRDAGALRDAARGCEVVFHEAAIVSVPYSVEHPRETHAVNLEGTLNVLDAARHAKTRRVVFASSAAVYGDDPALPKREDMRPSPIAPYGIEKLAGEHYLAVYARLYGLETVALRYFNVFGPRQDPSSAYSGVISIFGLRARRGEGVTIFGDGSASRDFVYVDDVVQANLLAASVPDVSGRVFNVARGESTTLNELAFMVGRVFGRRLDVTHAPPRAGDIAHSLADVTLARRDLGYEPKVAVEDGLERLMATP